jgi:hypothetical protein
MLHCWADGPPAKDGMSQTCMLEDGHKGPHEWTPDDEVVVTLYVSKKQYIISGRPCKIYLTDLPDVL